MTEKSIDIINLPRGWILINVCELKGVSGIVKDGDWILSKDLKTAKEIRLIQLSDVGQGYFLDKSNKFISKRRAQELKCTFLEKGDILVSRMAYPIARACILPNLNYNCITAVDITIIRTNEEFFNKKLICWIFNSELVKKRAERLSSGTTRKRITRKNLEQIKIPLPPFPEQHRIIVKIEELFTKLDAGVEALKKVKGQIKRYRQSVLKYAFEGKLTEEWRKENKDQLEPASALLQKIKEERKKKDKGKYKKQPKLPDTWTWIPLEFIIVVISGQAFKSNDFKSKGIPVIKIANISYGKFIWKQQEYLPNDFLNLFSNYKINPGTLLISLTRPITKEKLKVCLYPYDAPIGLLNQRVAALYPHKEFDIRYFLYLFQSEYFKNEIKKGMSETLQPNLSPNKLKTFILPISSIKEQKKIVEEINRHFSIADEVEKNIEQSIKQAESLRQSILKRAFEGKLVPQDPIDEPAEKLLERIKQEKSKREVKRTTKRNIKR